LEIDTFWSTVGGVDTLALLRSLGDRVQSVDVKDGPVTGDIAIALPSSDRAVKVPEALQHAFNSQVPAGQGDVDVATVLAAAPHALRVIEFDGYSGDIFEGIAVSIEWPQENDK
jgi:sugar phosphate isomerase/epimerase